MPENASGNLKATAEWAKFLKILLLLRIEERMNKRSPISEENSDKKMSHADMIEASQDATDVVLDGVRLANTLVGTRTCEGPKGSLVVGNSKCIYPNKYISSS